MHLDLFYYVENLHFFAVGAQNQKVCFTRKFSLRLRYDFCFRNLDPLTETVSFQEVHIMQILCCVIWQKYHALQCIFYLMMIVFTHH